MKKIVVACGTGVATSAMVALRVGELLDANGYAGSYELVRCAIDDTPRECADADLLIATTIAPVGVPFLTGRGRADAERFILETMAR